MEVVEVGAILPLPDPPDTSGISARTLDFLYGVMQECWAMEATERPIFKELRQKVGNFRSALQREFDLSGSAAPSDESSDEEDFELDPSHFASIGHFARKEHNPYMGNNGEVTDGSYSSPIPKGKTNSEATDGGYHSSPVQKHAMTSEATDGGYYSSPVKKGNATDPSARHNATQADPPEGSYATMIISTEEAEARTYSPAVARKAHDNSLKEYATTSRIS